MTGNPFRAQAEQETIVTGNRFNPGAWTARATVVVAVVAGLLAPSWANPSHTITVPVTRSETL
ncbi:MAG: hypothetical protein H0U16_07315, partial [Actinobacteria bacterium]|nr:hypothetical protein [Actinomycetota bacterium]